METAITLVSLLQRIASLITVPATQGVWVTAELSDVAVRGGHCYMELLQKNTETGATEARVRANIWSTTYQRIACEFLNSTGQQFTTGIKVMVRVSAQMHPVFGLSLNITAVNPEYTMGDMMRCRREILLRLQREGILEANRRLQWCDIPQRIAIISAPGAAGYGDFINQLYTNPAHLRFSSKLFPAVMQGEKAPTSIIDALRCIAAQIDCWDGVVIIRGGGATSDLQAFDDYNLAAAIAQFAIPVVIGIGHERDITVLDYVANMRVKTPTAAAEWLISKGTKAIDTLQRLAADIHRHVSDRIAGMTQQLAYFQGILPMLPQTVIDKAESRLQNARLELSQISSRRISPAMLSLDHRQESITNAIHTFINQETRRLDSLAQLTKALSPMATLRRGYTITRCNGKNISSANAVAKGSIIETITADGTITSITK